MTDRYFFLHEFNAIKSHENHCYYIFFLGSCSSTKKIQLKSTDRQAMIDLAIDDFLKKPRLIEKNAVFSLSFSTVRSKRDL